MISCVFISAARFTKHGVAGPKYIYMQIFSYSRQTHTSQNTRWCRGRTCMEEKQKQSEPCSLGHRKTLQLSSRSAL